MRNSGQISLSDEKGRTAHTSQFVALFNEICISFGSSEVVDPSGPRRKSDLLWRCRQILFSQTLSISFWLSLSTAFGSKTALLACLPYWNWQGYISNIFKECNLINKYCPHIQTARIHRSYSHTGMLQVDFISKWFWWFDI